MQETHICPTCGSTNTMVYYKVSVDDVDVLYCFDCNNDSRYYEKEGGDFEEVEEDF